MQYHSFVAFEILCSLTRSFVARKKLEDKLSKSWFMKILLKFFCTCIVSNKVDLAYVLALRQ